MTVQEQHIDFKRKLNKIDSEKYRNFRPEEIDLYLNEGMEVFIKKRIGRNNLYRKGFESTQKRIEDLRDLHVKAEDDAAQPLIGTLVGTGVYKYDLSTLGSVNDKLKYLYQTRVRFVGTAGDCTDIKFNGIPAQADDLNNILSSEFYSPSLAWREVPFNFAGDFVYAYTGDDFTLDSILIDYIRRPAKIANPNAIKDNAGNIIGYSYPDGTPAVQTDCEIQSMYGPSEIVDEAIRIAMIDLGDKRIQLENIKLANNE